MKYKLFNCWFRLLLILTCVFMMLFLTAQFHKRNKLPQGYYYVKINNELAGYYAKYTPSAPYNIMLPFVSLVESLGGTFDWQNDTEAYLLLNGDTYIFDLESVSLCPPGSKSDLLFPPAGFTGRSTEKTEKEAYVDGRTLHFFLIRYLDARIAEIDDEQQLVILETK